ncbi:uncharacterized protein K441DRAFT_661528 [Cenococcum geophilum 1.58]|uniref:uncharacterized protein n=1 Tax=Cenococcum geophilum 1.58 TaxID=794803 RepID=UPI00358EA78E|nr:hypothetical protein K441DRAFT_661528 [Cenococcum geophilum 1.58]
MVGKYIILGIALFCLFTSLFLSFSQYPFPYLFSSVSFLLCFFPSPPLNATKTLQQMLWIQN